MNDDSKQWDPGEQIGRLFNPPTDRGDWVDRMMAEQADSGDGEESGDAVSAWLARAKQLAAQLENSQHNEPDDGWSTAEPQAAAHPVDTAADTAANTQAWPQETDDVTALLGPVNEDLDLLGAAPEPDTTPPPAPLPGVAPQRRRGERGTVAPVEAWIASTTAAAAALNDSDDSDDDLEGLFSDVTTSGQRTALIGMLNEQMQDHAAGRDDDSDLYQDETMPSATRSKLADKVRAIGKQLSSDNRVTDLLKTFVLTRDPNVDLAQRTQLEPHTRQAITRSGVAVTSDEADMLTDLTYDEIIGLGPMAPPWRDDTVTEIMVDNWDRIVVEQNGQLKATDLRFNSREHAEEVARRLARLVSDRQLSNTNTLVTAQLDQARVHFAYGPVTATGLYINLRKQFRLLGMDSLLAKGSLDEEMAEFLHEAVYARATVLVSGGTGVGKTTFINALSESVPDTERVVTIEDSFELQLANKYVVSLQTKERASADDANLVDQEMLLVSALRMRPDRIIVGEIREPKAAFTMLAAANTGHDGTMTTIHANSAGSALNSRLANLVRVGGGLPDDVAKREIVDAFDLVVQVSRANRKRFVSSISAVETIEHGVIVPRELFRGTMNADGSVTFEQTGELAEGDALTAKMRAVGWDAGRWM